MKALTPADAVRAVREIGEMSTSMDNWCFRGRVRSPPPAVLHGRPAHDSAGEGFGAFATLVAWLAPLLCETPEAYAGDGGKEADARQGACPVPPQGRW
jgi:hypothetical protein